MQEKAQWPIERVLQELANQISDVLQQQPPNLGSDPKTAFRQYWLPQLLNNLPVDTSLALLFDEFDVLEEPQSEPAGADFFPYWRELLNAHPTRLNSVFVIGRPVQVLTHIALSLFEQTKPILVSLLSQQDTRQLVCLSETNNSLTWSDDAVEAVWQLGAGHPFLTQHLCFGVWESLYNNSHITTVPTVTLTDIEAATPKTLEANHHILEELWNSLPSTERIVAASLAGSTQTSQRELEDILSQNQIPVVIRKLSEALRFLTDWDLIEEPKKKSYRFKVELLRRWVAEYKPLSFVQDELDKELPDAKKGWSGIIEMSFIDKKSFSLFYQSTK